MNKYLNYLSIVLIILPILLISIPFLLARILHTAVILPLDLAWKIYIITSMIVTGASLYFQYDTDWRDLIEEKN